MKNKIKSWGIDLNENSKEIREQAKKMLAKANIK